jgi:hypothetical protein
VVGRELVGQVVVGQVVVRQELVGRQLELHVDVASCPGRVFDVFTCSLLP